MPDGYSLVIDGVEFADPLSRIHFTRDAIPGADGKIEATDWRIEMDAAVVVDPPDADEVVAGMFARADLVAQPARTVELRLDGVTKRTWTPSDSHVGPFVTHFETIPSRGAGHSHWSYRFAVVVRTKENDNCYNLEVRVRTETDKNGEVVRKVWSASANARTKEIARDCILDYKPGVAGIAEILELWERKEIAGAMAEWTWEREQKNKKKIKWHRCHVFRERGPLYVESRQVGADTAGPSTAFPKAHRRRLPPVTHLVEGEIAGYDPAELKVPPLHFEESAEMILVARRTQGEPEVLDPKEGTYLLRYSETWWALDGTERTANHSEDHHLLPVDEEPPSGAAG